MSEVESCQADLLEEVECQVADTGQRPVVAQLDGRDDRGARLCQVAEVAVCQLRAVDPDLRSAAWPFSVATSMVLTVPAICVVGQQNGGLGALRHPAVVARG